MKTHPYPLIGATCLIEAAFLFYVIQQDMTCKWHVPWFNINDNELVEGWVKLT